MTLREHLLQPRPWRVLLVDRSHLLDRINMATTLRPRRPATRVVQPRPQQKAQEVSDQDLLRSAVSLRLCSDQATNATTTSKARSSHPTTIVQRVGGIDDREPIDAQTGNLVTTARASTSAMTVGVTWTRCLDKRDHAISEGAEVLGGGHLKAVCSTQVYPLGLSTECTRRYCRGCIKALSAAPESCPLPQRIPGQVLRQLRRRFHGVIR